MEKFKAMFSGLREWMGKKLIVTAVGLFLAALRAKHPEWPLPSEEFTLSLVGAYMVCHTLTDVWHITQTALTEYLAGKAK